MDLFYCYIGFCGETNVFWLGINDYQNLQRMVCIYQTKLQYNWLQNYWDTWPLFVNSWISQPQVKNPPPPCTMLVRHKIIRVPGRVINTDQGGGGGKFSKQHIFLAIVWSSSRRFQICAKCHNTFATDCGMSICLPSYSHSHHPYTTYSTVYITGLFGTQMGNQLGLLLWSG